MLHCTMSGRNLTFDPWSRTIQLGSASVFWFNALKELCSQIEDDNKSGPHRTSSSIKFVLKTNDEPVECGVDWKKALVFYFGFEFCGITEHRKHLMDPTFYFCRRVAESHARALTHTGSTLRPRSQESNLACQLELISVKSSSDPRILARRAGHPTMNFIWFQGQRWCPLLWNKLFG